MALTRSSCLSDLRGGWSHRLCCSQLSSTFFSVWPCTSWASSWYRSSLGISRSVTGISVASNLAPWSLISVKHGPNEGRERSLHLSRVLIPLNPVGEITNNHLSFYYMLWPVLLNNERMVRGSNFPGLSHFKEPGLKFNELIKIFSFQNCPVQ